MSVHSRVRPSYDRSTSINIKEPADLKEICSNFSLRRCPSLTTQLLHNDLSVRHPYRSLVADDVRGCSHYTVIHVLTLTICLVTVPIRAIILVFSFCMVLIITAIMTIGVKLGTLDDYQDVPAMSPFRRKLMHYLVKFWMRIILFCMGVWWIKINGSENFSKDAKIVGAGPHGTFLDGVIMMQIMDAPFTGIAAMNEGRRPGTGLFMRALDYMFIDYKSTKSRKDCAKGLVMRATSEKWAHLKMFLMCEGTTNNGTHLCQVKRGAFMPGVPIQPVVLEFPEWIDVLKCNINEDRTSLRGAGWASWGHEVNVAWLILYQLCVPWQPVIVDVLPTYYPTDDEKADTLLFSHNVRKEMEKATRFKILRCNRLDGALCEYGKEKGYKIDNFICFGEILEERYGTRVVKDDSLKVLLDKFVEAGNGQPFVPAIDLGIEASGEMVNFHEFCDDYFKKEKAKQSVVQ